MVIFSLGHLQSEAGVFTKQPLLWSDAGCVSGPLRGRWEAPWTGCPGGTLQLGVAFHKSSGVFALFPPWEKENGRSTLFPAGLSGVGVVERDGEGRILGEGKATGRRMKSVWLSAEEHGWSHWTGGAEILLRGTDDSFLMTCSPWIRSAQEVAEAPGVELIPRPPGCLRVFAA